MKAIEKELIRERLEYWAYLQNYSAEPIVRLKMTHKIEAGIELASVLGVHLESKVDERGKLCIY